MVKSPPSTSIFFFFFLSWSNHLSTTSTNLHQKNQNPPAPQESKPTSMDSVDPQASISAASTNPQASKPIPVDSQALISATNIDSQASRPISVDPRTLILRHYHQSISDQHQNWFVSLLVWLRGCVCVWVSLCLCLCISMLICLCGCVWVWVCLCLCVSKEKDDMERRSQFVLHREERKKAQNVKLIK